MDAEPKVATGREIILEIVRAMRANLEPLLYSTIAPSRFFVYLHPDDYRRLEGILSVVASEARRALDADVDAWNAENQPARVRLPWRSREKKARLDPPADGWAIRFEPDGDEEMQPGDIAVVSELSLPPPAEFAGSRTRRVTVKSGEAAPRTAEVVDIPAQISSAGGTVYATITYEDQAGTHTFAVTRDQVVIGRGGLGYWVDLKLQTAPDVSREHVRLRRDAETGQFFLKDLSSLGTTLDGRAVSPGFEVVDGAKRDNGVEVLLPDRARIGLAETVFLDFEIRRAP
ncbi:MAG: FHA domain-containing protein [Vicinamibacterales bacterium]